MLARRLPGGRAFLDSNDFGKVFTGVQQDTSLYYLLGYHSSNAARDGHFRRITVWVNRPGVEDRFPARLLRSRRLPALHSQLMTIANANSMRNWHPTFLRPTSPGIFIRRLLPSGGAQVLCASVGSCARFLDLPSPTAMTQDRATLDILES